MKKLLAVLLATVMVIGLFAGCASSNPNTPATTPATTPNTPDTPATTPAASDDIPTIVWYSVGGGQPQNYDAWLAQINPYLEEKIGAHIDMRIVSWSDWSDRRSVIVSTNEPYDIMFTDYGSYTSDVDLGAFAPLNDLLEGTPELKNLLPEDFWEAVKIQGNIYGVPAYKDSSMTNFFVWDADVAAEYFPGYKDAHTLPEVAEGVKAIYEATGENPIGLHKDGLGGLVSGYDGLALGLPTLGISFSATDNKIVSVYEQEDSLANLRLMHEMFEAGYVNQDAANLETAPQYKVLSTAQGWPYAAKNVWGPAMGNSPRTGEPVNCEAIQMYDTYLSSDTIMGSMLCISNSSANKEKALALIQLVNTDTYVRDLLYYGVEGENFEYVDVNGEKRVHKINNDWTMAGYTQGTFFNVTLTEDTEFNYWTEVQHQNETAIASPALGFLVDTSEIKDQISACKAVYENYKPLLLTGAMDPDEIVPRMMEEMRANGFDDVLAEVQAQFDAWLAAK